MVLVRDLQQALFKDGITLIAGETGLNRKIDYLTVQEFSFKTSRLHKNGFVMTTFYGFTNMDEIIDHFAWYVEIEVSAIGFHTAIYSEIPEKLIELANETEIPLFHIPSNVPYHLIYERYNHLIDEETNKLKNSIDKLNQSMLDALVLEKDIHFIIQSLGKYLGVPIIYLNKELELLSLWNTRAVSRVDLRNWADQFIVNYVNLFETARLSNQLIEERDLHKVSQIKSILMIPLSNSLSFYGYLLILNQTEPVPFQDIILKNTVTALILDAIKKNQTLEFQKNKDIKQFEEIFLHKNVSEVRGEDFFYDINKLHSILMVEPDQSSDLKQCYQFIKKYIDETDRNALVWVMERKIIALLQMEFQNKIPNHLNMKIGISGKRLNISTQEIQQLYEQAKISLHFCHILEKNQCKWTDLGIEQISYFMSESVLLRDFYKDYLNDLIVYDNQNQTDLVKTLYVFLSSFFSLKESGNQLHLHPNTVKYRINKIQEILTIPLDDPIHYMNLMISLKSYFYTLKRQSLNEVGR